jgi:NADH-quinone oxidoreductase subunit J
MQDAFFYLFAILTLGCGGLVIANPFTRSPVTSAMFLVLTIVFLAGLFVLLHAFFLAAVQVLVYAGAVIVLFLFVIMLLDLKEEEMRQVKGVMTVLGGLAAAAIAYVMIETVRHAKLSSQVSPPVVEGATEDLGRILFVQYALPFEIVSLLLVVAMIGAILLSKKDLK